MPELDDKYAPRKMSGRETAAFGLKLAVAAAIVFGLVWIAERAVH